MAEGVYNNPILPGFNPDPSIIRVGRGYFLVTSTFEYFPGVPVYHSTDLIQWTLIGHCLTRRSQLDIRTPEPGGGIWAPTLRFHNGWYYMATCAFDRYRPQHDDRVWPRGFYVRTRDIWDSDSWSDPVYFDQPGFDQDLFWDDDGTCYLSTTYRKLDRDPASKTKDFCIHTSTIDIETGNSTSQPVLLRESSASGVSEGSHIFRRGGYYYLFTAEGGTESGHSEWVLRSDKGPLGPYELGPRNPLWRNTTEHEIQNTGHCDLVEDGEGRWWAVSLGVRPVRVEGEFQTSVFGRESLLMPVEWEDDWPIFNQGKPLTLEMRAPSLYKREPPKAWRDDFTGPDMQLGWYRKNTPLKTDFALANSTLELHGGPYTLSSPAAPTLFLRKQCRRETLWTTRLGFVPGSARTEAGAVVYWNYFTYSSIGIRADPGMGRVIRYRPAEGEEVVLPLRTADGDVLLAIDCRLTSYRLGFVEVTADEEEKEEEEEAELVNRVNWVGEVSTAAMTRDPEVGMPFTGMTLGLYAFGDMERCLTPAVFRFAQFS
ncbi:glycosyl hydrolase [Microdochium bolleyi]|uniref:Glycosyl hydrolase n=1 Tax=Microdochium bolleyi TaxID=196109 RepID=A0A136IKN9_9PEZI|nr:glycosyl hydrolase [Microdochium bolleyi]